MMTAGMYKYVSDMDPETWNREGIIEYAVDPYELLFYEEGLSSVVTVAKSRTTENIWLANNGKVDASTRVDMPTRCSSPTSPSCLQTRQTRRPWSVSRAASPPAPC